MRACPYILDCAWLPSTDHDDIHSHEEPNAMLGKPGYPTQESSQTLVLALM